MEEGRQRIGPSAAFTACANFLFAKWASFRGLNWLKKLSPPMMWRSDPLCSYPLSILPTSRRALNFFVSWILACLVCSPQMFAILKGVGGVVQ